MENSTVRRAIVLMALITCSILLLSWVVDRAAENAPDPTPTASVTATVSA